MTTYRELIGDRYFESMAYAEFLDDTVSYVYLPKQGRESAWDFEVRFSDGSYDFFYYPKAELIQRCLALGVPFLESNPSMEEK